MKKDHSIALFNKKTVRRQWDDEKELWYFSVIDVIEALTDSSRPRKYWNDLKAKLQEEGSELSEKIGQLKMQASDGKYYSTDVADTRTMLRLIQSISSPKAEPFKLWLAGVAGVARKEIERQTGRSVVTSANAKSLRSGKYSLSKKLAESKR